MRLWMKWGFVGAIIGIIPVTLYYLGCENFDYLGYLFCKILQIPGVVGIRYLGVECNPDCDPNGPWLLRCVCTNPLFFLINILSWAIIGGMIGAIFGFIIKKIR